MTRTARTVRVLGEDALQLGEGARLVDGHVVHVDILAGRLLRHGCERPGPAELLHDLDVVLGAVAPVAGRPGHWVCAAGDGVAVLGPDGGLDWLDRPEARHGGATRMNDGVADVRGRFWAGSMAYDGSSPLGSLYRVDPDGSVEQVLDGLAVANGPAVSDDGRTMFLADSARGTITRYAVDDAGHLADPQVVLREPPGSVPDGMTTDAEGHLWVAFWGGAQVRRFSPDGEPLLVVDLPARQPTSLALLDGRAVVTTARHGLADPGPADGRLLEVDLADVPAVTARPARAWG